MNVVPVTPNLGVKVPLLLTSWTSSSFVGGGTMLLVSEGGFNLSVGEFSFSVEKNLIFDRKLVKGVLMIFGLGVKDD